MKKSTKLFKKLIRKEIKKFILKEGKVWERGFGEPLPTLKSVQEKHNANNRSLNEAEVTPEMLLQVQQALPDLEKLIQKHSGVKAKLMAEMNRENLHIYSDNLIGQISPLGRTVFKEINISFWGGSYIEKTNQIWFNPKTDYEHPSGGSNGADFIWQSLWFKLDKNAWVEGRRLGR